MYCIPKSCEAVFFDLNGTLLRDLECHYHAYRALLGEFGITITKQIFLERIANRTNSEILLSFFGSGLNDEEIVAMTSVKTERYFALLDTNITPVAGAEELLQNLQAQGKPCFVVTSAGAEATKRTVEELGLAQYFAGYATSNLVARGKPYPDVYELALRMAETSSRQVVAFEDSPHGINAAHAAGIAAVGVVGDYSEQDLQNSGAVSLIHDFTEVHLELV
jgi:beta-phosphoglucomutase